MDFPEDDDAMFYQILDDISKGNYGKKTDDDLLGESTDFNESLGMLSNLDEMKRTLKNLKKQGGQFTIELDGRSL